MRELFFRADPRILRPCFRCPDPGRFEGLSSLNSEKIEKSGRDLEKIKAGEDFRKKGLPRGLPRFCPNFVPGRLPRYDKVSQ